MKVEKKRKPGKKKRGEDTIPTFCIQKVKGKKGKIKKNQRGNQLM